MSGGVAAAAFRAFTEIAIINQLASRAFERVLPPGLTLSQFGVLDHLLRLGGDWSPARLANAFQVTRPTMTNTLQRLSASGLVTVTGNAADGRAKLVRITPRGAAERDAAVAALAPVLAAVATAVPADLFTTLLPPLTQLRQHLDTARDA